LDVAAREAYDPPELSRRGKALICWGGAGWLGGVGCHSEIGRLLRGTAARLTLNYPLTFESLGSELQIFEGWALRDLVNFQKSRCDDVISCFESFLDIRIGPSKIWVGCPNESIAKRGGSISTPQPAADSPQPSLPSWLDGFFESQICELKSDFMDAIIEPSSIRTKYLAALQRHVSRNRFQNGCEFCLRVHTCQGEEYCAQLERSLARAQDKVSAVIIVQGHF